MPAARAAASRLIPSRALASASRRLLTRPSRSRRAIARRSAGVRPVAIATATMAQAPGLLSLPGQPAGRRPRSRLPVAGIIPTALVGDRFGPLAAGDRGQAVGRRHEPVPRLAAGRDDGLVVRPDPQAEFVLPQVLPHVLDRVQLGAVARQG